MEDTETPNLREMEKELSENAAELGKMMMETVPDLDRFERVYSYLLKSNFLFVLVISFAELVLAILSPDPTAMLLLGLAWVFLVGLLILGYKQRDAFYALTTIFEALWRSNFKYSLEFMAAKGKDPIETILKKLKMAFPDLNEVIKENPDSVKVNEEIVGRSGKHRFDVLVHVDASFLRRLTLGVLGKPGFDFIVNRFTKEDPVTEDDLSQLRAEILDVYPLSRFRRRAIDGIVVVSTSSFTDAAVSFAMRGENWIPPVKLEKGGEPPIDTLAYMEQAAESEIDYCTFDLIEETPDRHRVIWAL